MPTHVLMVIADDLRTLSRPTGGASLTPALDQFAAESVVFARHYTSSPSCSPARTALLTSRRPDATRTHDLWSYWRHTGGDNTTSLPQWFRARGYHTIGIGKVFHPHHASGQIDDAGEEGGPSGEDQDALFSWTVPFWRVPESIVATERARNRSWSVVQADEARALPDAQIAERAASELLRLHRELASDDAFLIVAGFLRPHLPFVVPASSFQFVRTAMSLDSVFGALSPLPDGLPRQAIHGSGELSNFPDVAGATGTEGRGHSSLAWPSMVAASVAPALRLAYAAAVHHLDRQVGHVLHTLTRATRFANSTIMLFTADHGFSLGERGIWGKHHLLEATLRVPLLLRVPGQRAMRSDAITEHVDLLPTLALLALHERIPRCTGPTYSRGTGVPVASAATDAGVADTAGSAARRRAHCTDGRALLERGLVTARHELPRGVAQLACSQHPATPAGRAKASPCVTSRCTMGYSVTIRLALGGHIHRLTRWVRYSAHGGPEWDQVAASEWYNLSDSVGESRNLLAHSSPPTRGRGGDRLTLAAGAAGRATEWLTVGDGADVFRFACAADAS